MARIAPVSINPAGGPAGGIGFLGVLFPDNFPDKSTGPLRAGWVAATERSHGCHHSAPDRSLLPFVAVSRTALPFQPVSSDLLQQLRQGGAFPPGLAFQFSLLLGGNAAGVDLIL